MHGPYDITQLSDLAQPGLPASSIRDELSLGISARQVQRLSQDRLGAQPTRRAVERYDPLRSRVVAYMDSQGLDQRYCVEGHRSCLIRSGTRPEPGLAGPRLRQHSVPGDGVDMRTSLV